MYMIGAGTWLKRLADNNLDMDVKLLQALQSCQVGFHLLPLPKAGQRAEVQTTPLGGGQQHGGKGVSAPKDGICAAEETASLRTLRKRTTTRRSDGVAASVPWLTPVQHCMTVW